MPGARPAGTGVRHSSLRCTMSYAKKWAWTTSLSLPFFLPFFGFGAFTVTVCEPVNQTTGPEFPASGPTARPGRSAKASV